MTKAHLVRRGHVSQALTDNIFHHLTDIFTFSRSQHFFLLKYGCLISELFPLISYFQLVLAQYSSSGKWYITIQYWTKSRDTTRYNIAMLCRTTVWLKRTSKPPAMLPGTWWQVCAQSSVMAPWRLYTEVAVDVMMSLVLKMFLTFMPCMYCMCVCTAIIIYLIIQRMLCRRRGPLSTSTVQ